ncbi:MAG: hypothetical protein JXR77_16115 [Lentisphaeria bacterium]|nr:hypothetical protein [Lentisphaeria bacterium]
MTRFLDVVGLGLLLGCIPVLSALPPGAAVRVHADRPVMVRLLEPGVPVHGNRSYRFDRVSPEVVGWAFACGPHKDPATIEVTVEEAGVLLVAMAEGEPGSPASRPTPTALGIPGTWVETAHLVSVVGGASYAWTAYARQVMQGEVLKIGSGNRWGTAVLARAIAGGTENATEPPAPWGPADETRREYALLARQIREHGAWDLHRLAAEALRPEALVNAADVTPVHIVLRRTRALLEHLAAQHPELDFAAASAELCALEARNLQPLGEEARFELFAESAALRRRIAFRNPLLDFDRILFLKHHRAAFEHMCDQYYGFYARPGGGLFVLEDAFGASPRLRDVLARSRVTGGRLAGRPLEGGSFVSLELSYDARSVFFAWTEAEATPQRWSPRSTYHVFRADVDGGHLTQLTDGPWNDFDPCLLPDGSLVFVSERCGGYLRCGRNCPTYTLHAMQADGSGMRRLSFHETHEWHPSIDHDGMIVYTRWDYVDRDSDIAHHLWTCHPDGRNARSLHGNYPERRELRPWMELAIRAVPGSRRYVATAAAHHGQNYGSLILIDPALPDDGATAQIRRLTPEAPFPESESAPGVPQRKGRHAPRAEVFGTAWPLSEDFHLCVYDPGQAVYGIYLVDSFGNRELLYRDSAIACLDPIPLRPRATPPALPSPLPPAGEADSAPPPMGTVAVMNIYAGEQPWPRGATLRELRIVNLFPKSTPPPDVPRIGHADQSLARGVLGTVPIEIDGSVFFRMPAGIPVYFQALDERGLAVQSMRSLTYLQPGEDMQCLGCHEPKRGTPSTRNGHPLALRRPPSEIAPEAPGAMPLTFPRLVQPVLDARCIGCHSLDPKRPSLRGDRFGAHGWSEAFHTLRRSAWGRSGGNGALMSLNQRSYSLPGQEGARAAKLYTMLAGGHHDLELAPGELRCITLWLDCNSTFYGAYEEIGKQASGEVVLPLLGLAPGTGPAYGLPEAP